MKKSLLLLLLCSAVFTINAQWVTTNSPLSSYRHDDVFFINPEVGWAVNFSLGDNGYVIKTIDGGANWIKQVDSSGAKFRDIAFLDSQTGFIGTLSTGYNPEDTTIMYKTVDGGTSWTNVIMPGPRPSGICGMFAVNDTTLYACGRYFGPAGIYKTSNKGLTWTYKDLNALAGGLVDVYFFNNDTGIALGGSDANYLNSYGRVLRTVDGGANWTIVHTSTHLKEIGWKLSFPSANIGYASLQSFGPSGPKYFLKTINGGLTWVEMPFMTGTYNAQGIGFLNDSTGWIGGGTSNYKTINGGLNWTIENFGTPINRFRFIGDSIGYAAGKYIYKYQFSGSGVGVADLKQSTPPVLYPNPFSTTITISKPLEATMNCILYIYDCVGRQVYSKKLNSDATEVLTPDLNRGLYFYHIIGPNNNSWNGELIRN